jgi:diguanylate cyclase (GGDEF)-like protein/PAS domain S-box-containing protein
MTARVIRASAFAVLSVAAALLLTLVLPPMRQQFRFLLFALAIFVSAAEGLWQGLLATLLSLVASAFLLIGRLHSFSAAASALAAPLCAFCLVGVVTTWIACRQRRSAEAARAAEEVIESSADAIVRQSLDGTILNWNKAAEHTYGFSAEEAIGRPGSIMVPPDSLEELHRLIERVHEGGSIQNHETVRVRKDGTRINVALTLSAIRNRHGKTAAISAITRDIGERKRAEAAIRTANEKLQRQAHQLKLLAEMGTLLHASSKPADAYAVAARFAQQLIPGSSGAVFAYLVPTHELEAVSRWGEVQAGERDFLAFDDCRALRTGHAHFVEDWRTSLLCRHLPEPPPACYLCVPMISHGETYGLLHLRLRPPGQASAGGAPLEPVEFPWPATSIAEQLALAVGNMQLREALRSQSIRDPLTGWLNRRYMEETLEREILRASRARHPLAVFMLDVDHFKEFNDSVGHQAGDIMLQNLCQTLKSHVRDEDVACRYGGDEFVLVLPGTTDKQAEKRAEEMRKAVAELGQQYLGKLPGLLTLSIGIATFPTDGNTFQQLLRAADGALFLAKSEGRNRVRLHSKA